VSMFNRIVTWRVRKRELWAQSGDGRRDHAIIGYRPDLHQAISLCGAAIPMIRVEVDYRPDEARCCKTCWSMASSSGAINAICPVCSHMVMRYPNGKLRYHTLSFRVPCPGAGKKA
jgi:hypothetical protein